MSVREVFEKASASIQAHDIDGYARLLSEDAKFTGPGPEPLGKQAYLATLRTMLNAFPDLQYHYRIIGDDGNLLRYASYFSGAHTGELDLSTWSMGIVPATGKTFRTSEEVGEVTVENGRITRIQIHARENGGIRGILKQIGIQLD
jgi:predicted ester cyclase